MGVAYTQFDNEKRTFHQKKGKSHNGELVGFYLEKCFPFITYYYQVSHRGCKYIKFSRDRGGTFKQVAGYQRSESRFW